MRGCSLRVGLENRSTEAVSRSWYCLKHAAISREFCEGLLGLVGMSDGCWLPAEEGRGLEGEEKVSS
jgi:hypothetical protein